MKQGTPSGHFDVVALRLSDTIDRIACRLAGSPDESLADDLRQDMWIAIMEDGPGQTDSYYLSKARRVALAHVLSDKEEPIKDAPGWQRPSDRLARSVLDLEHLGWNAAPSKATRGPQVPDEVEDCRLPDMTWARRSFSFGIVAHHWTTMGAVREGTDTYRHPRVHRKPARRKMLVEIGKRAGTGGIVADVYALHELHAVLDAMPADARALAQALMKGYETFEIAEELKVSDRTVLRRIKALAEYFPRRAE